MGELYNEDCKDTLIRMDNNFIDLVITSPPYYNAKEYFACFSKKRKSQ